MINLNNNSLPSCAYRFFSCFILLTIWLLSYPAVSWGDISTGLVAYYIFDGDATDSTGNYNGIVHGAVLTDDRYGNPDSAYQFNGASYIEIYDGGELIPKNTVSLSSWIFIPESSFQQDSCQHTIFVQNDLAGRVTHQIRAGQGNCAPEEIVPVIGYDNWGPANGSINSASPISFGYWHHVAVVRDGDYINIYIDGNKRGEGIGEPRLNATDIDNTLIGSRFYNGAVHHGFYGKIDDLRIYNRALSESDVSQIYALERPAVDLVSNLVAHYEFDGNANDSSGNGNNGTEDGNVEYVTGVKGQAAHFDGNTKLVANDPFPTGTTEHDPITVSMWVATTTSNSSAALVNQWTACTDVGGGDNWHFTLYGAPNGLQAEIANSSEPFANRNLVVDGFFHHVSFVYTGNNLTIYIDGKEQVSQVYSPGTSFEHGTPLGIGGFSSTGCAIDQSFNGSIDELRIYNRALSSLEIKTLYNKNSDIIPVEVSQATPTEKNQATSTYTAAFDGRTLTCGSPGPVVASSGNFTHTHNDFTIPSLGPNLNITRYYNSQDLYDGPFGHGWNTDYTAQLVIAEEQDGTTSATVRLGNGVRRKFIANGDGTFTAPQGQDDTLFNAGTVDTPVYVFNGACGTGCTPKPRTAYTFNAGGWLTVISDRNNNQLSIGYDGLGRVGTVTDANGRNISFIYGTNGRVESINDFAGRSWSYGYDDDDNLTSVTDPLTNTITYQYDSAHNLTAVIDSMGNTVSSVSYDQGDKAAGFIENGGNYQLSYDPVSQVTSKINPAGGLFQFQYDNNGNITNKTGPLGKSLDLTWDANVNLTEKVNGLGVTTSYSYDMQHNITGIIRDAGGLNLSTAYQYDPVTGQVNQITDPAGSISSMSYDANGNLLTRTMPIGSSQYEYTASGLPARSTDPDGVQTGFEYDSNGYLTRSWVVDSNPLVETTYTYDSRGNRLTMTDPLGDTTTYTYDALNRVTSVEDALLQTITFQYDSNSNLTRLTNAGGIFTDFVYDNNDRLISKVEAVGTPLERSTSYTYDTRGNLLTVTNPLNYTTSYTYDELSRQTMACDHLNQCWAFVYDEVGNLVSKVDPNNNSTSFSYDTVGRLASVTDAEDHTTSYGYDSNSNLLTVIDANANPATTNVYDANNRLTSTKDALNYTTSHTYTDASRLATVTDANGQVTTYVYDAVSGQLSEIQYPAGRTQSFTYDLVGRVLTIADSATGQSITYTYDALGRMASETQLGQTLSYSYDINGKRLAVSLAGVGDYSYAHDELNHYTAITNPDFEITGFEYNGADQLTRTTYENSSYTDYSYDEAGRLTGISHHKGDASLIASFTYTYNAMNNRLTETNGSGTITYTYDKTYKLLSATYPDGEVISFTYDPVGNRLSRTDSTGTISYNYDTVNRLTGETYPDTSSVAYSWDANGNVQTRTRTNVDDSTEITTYTYDILNKLIQLDLPDGTNNTYTYDPVGRRMRTTDGTAVTRYLYDGQNPLADISGDDAAPVYQTFYTPALGLDVLASRKQGSSSQYFLRDGLNSVRLVLNSDATIAATYEYQPYGAIRSQTGNSDNLFTFTGRRVEENNSLMYYRTRFYDPAVGRFLKKDGYTGSLGEPLSLHRYGYVHGNPANYLDPEGEVLTAAAVIGGGIIGGTIGGVAYGVSYWLDPDPNKKFDGYALAGAIGGGAVAGSVGVAAAAITTSGAVIGAAAGFTGSLVDKVITNFGEEEWDTSDGIDIIAGTALGAVGGHFGQKVLKGVRGVQPKKFITALIGAHARNAWTISASQIFSEKAGLFVGRSLPLAGIPASRDSTETSGWSFINDLEFVCADP